MSYALPNVYERSDEILGRLEIQTNAKPLHMLSGTSQMMAGIAIGQLLQEKGIRIQQHPGDSIEQQTQQFLDAARQVNLFYDRSAMGNPVIVPDRVARDWLELNYRTATHFFPDKLPAIGETGFDIRTVDENTYLTTDPLLYGLTQVAFHKFREVEEGVLAWQERSDGVYRAFAQLKEEIGGLETFQRGGLPLETELFHRISGTPNRLHELVDALQITFSSSQPLTVLSEQLMYLQQYDFARVEEVYGEIRRVHKTTPKSNRGLLYLDSPAASGGICGHTHPGGIDPLTAVLSWNDLFILASEAGTMPGVGHRVGAGETTGVVYVGHIPQGTFFEEVQEMVDGERTRIDAIVAEHGWSSDAMMELAQIVTPLRDEAVRKHLPDLMNNEILGFRFQYASTEPGERLLIVSPLVTESEFQVHQAALPTGLSREELGVEDMKLSFGENLGDYTSLFDA